MIRAGILAFIALALSTQLILIYGAVCSPVMMMVEQPSHCAETPAGREGHTAADCKTVCLLADSQIAVLRAFASSLHEQDIKPASDPAIELFFLADAELIFQAGSPWGWKQPQSSPAYLLSHAFRI